MWRHSRDMDLPTTQMDEKEHVIRHQPTQGPDLGGEEVGRHEDVHVCADKRLPRRSGLPFWSWRNAMALEDVAHRLSTDRQAQVGQGADDPVIAPGAILLGYANNQRFELLVDFGTAWRLPLLGAVKLVGDQFAVPGEDRVGFDDLGHFLQGLLAQLVADLSQGLALAITQPYPSLDLIAEHP